MQPQVKGQTMKSLLLFMQKNLQPEQIDRIMASVDPETRAQIERGILPTNTFPMSLLNQLTVEGARVKGVPLEEFARDIGRFSADEAVRGVYRFFARVLTPETILAKAASFWSAMNTVGRMEVASDGSGSALIRLIDYPSDPVMCLRIAGWIEKMADLTGAKNAVVRPLRCVAKGDPICEWRITW
jgi:hypothetical protein